ncbi:TetR/AcrR family transcriptional regulator [Enemella evansiae]|uniref:TetR/AcrR family transcriptional regulator n=1 Tax=Enemella evansiae TaxID=2016499 RepID=UPI0010E25C23|nr:TetR/AcrR family transcriptional regulator [Enemella evansiae]TDO88162.1 TetR family transcriptional regulator [Enemella evansiae]
MPRPRIAHRRERVLAAAEGVLVHRGFDAMTITRVATEAGIGKGAFYLEFGDKQELLEELLQLSLDRVIERVRRSGPGGLGEGVRRVVLALLGEPLLVAALLDDRRVLGVGAAVAAELRHAMQVALAAYLAALQEGGAVRAEPEPAAMAVAVLASITGFLTQARILGGAAAEVQAAADALALMVSGLAGGVAGDAELDPAGWLRLMVLLRH